MKKKRLIDSNTNNKKAALSIVKKSIEKKTNGNNNNIPNDKHHNRSTPCSNSVADIVREIFPSTNKDDGIKILSPDQYDCDGQLSAGKSTISKLYEGDQQQQQQQETEQPQPLLGYMIQSYLIEERKKVREQQNQQQRGSSINNNNSTTSTTTKKKKNKKKKKKKTANNNTTATATSTTTSSTVDGIECELENSKKDQNSSSRKVALSTLLSATSRDGIECELEKKNKKGGGGVGGGSSKVPTVATAPTEGESFDDNDTTSNVVAVTTTTTARDDSPNSVIPTLLPIQSESGGGGSSFISPLYGEEDHYDCNKVQQEEEQQSPSSITTNSELSELDRFLDSLIDSTSPSSASSKNVSNRNIEAFSTFLSRKLTTHLQEKNKSKAGSSSGTSSSLDQNNDCSSSSNRGGIEYKDILPTISINDATELCNSVDCRKCRSSTLKRLRTISSEEKVKSHKTDEGWEMELVPTKINKVVNYNTNTNTKDNNAYMIVTLDDESVKIPPLSSAMSDSGAAIKNTNSTNSNNNGLSIPVSGPLGDMLSDDLVENAFNYMSMDEMEAGYGQQEYDIEGGGGGGRCGGGEDYETKTKKKSSSFNLEFRPISRANESVRYLQVGLVPKMDGGDSDVSEEGSISEFPMKADDIIGLVKNILLPCGLGQVKGLGDDDNVTTDSTVHELGNDEMNQIADKAHEEVRSILTIIMRIKSKLYGITQQLEEVDHDKPTFDAKSNKILLGCDDNCELAMKEFGEILLQLSKVTCYVGWASTRGAKLMTFIRHLWSRYNAAFVELIEPVLQYRGKLVRMNIRGGSVPQAYTSLVVRNGLEELIRTKITVLQSLVEDLVGSISNGLSCKPSPVVVLYVLKAYREHAEQPKASFDDIFPDQASEELMHQFIVARITMSLKTIQGGKKVAIEKKAREHREEMFSLIKKIRGIVMAMEDFAPETKLDFLNEGYSSNEDAYYELERKLRNDDGTGSVGDALLLKKSFHLIMQWLILLCSKQCNESSMKSLTLPSRLDKWLNSTAGTEMKSMPGDDIKKNKNEECSGDAGQRRVSSILAALLYRWLEERCSEWHAELTSDELLQSMDMEDPVVVREGGKSGKKKKSKRKGKNKGGNEANVATQDVSKGTYDKKPVDKKSIESSTGEDKTVHNVEENERRDESFQLGADQMKDDVIDGVEDAACLKLTEDSLATMEDAIPVSSEGGWKVEKKSKRKEQSKENESHVQNTSKERPSNKKQIVASEREKVAPPSKGSGNKPEIDKEVVVNTGLNEKQVIAPTAKGIKSEVGVKSVPSVNKKPLITELKETPAKKKDGLSGYKSSKKSEGSINKETVNSERQEKVPSLKDWLSANSTVNEKPMSNEHKETAAVEEESSNSKMTKECSAAKPFSKSKKPVINEQQTKAKSDIDTKSVPVVVSKKPTSSESGKPALSMERTSSNSEQEEDVNKKPAVASEQKVKLSNIESSSEKKPVAIKKHLQDEAATKKCPHCAKPEIDVQPEISSKPEVTNSERQDGAAPATTNEPRSNENEDISEFQHQDKPPAVTKKVGSKVKVNATCVDEIEVVKGISNDDDEEEDFFFGVDDSKNDAVETVIAKKEEPQQTSTQQTASAGRVPPPNSAVNTNVIPQQPSQYSYPPPSHYYYPPPAHAQQYNYPPPQQYGYPAHPHYMYPPPPQQYCYPPPPHHMQQQQPMGNHQQQSYETNCEYYPTVSVVDGEQRVVAEMYLVKRLDVGTGSKKANSTSSTDKKKSSTDKNKVPVVWL